jgi:hypothetical protein
LFAVGHAFGLGCFGHPETGRWIWIQKFYPDDSNRFGMFTLNDWWANRRLEETEV